jgi:ABC-2 type transport system ATP-binding protein
VLFDLVGYLPDLTGLYDNLTTTEYLSFYARSFRIPLRRRRQLADELLELVDLTGHRNEPVTTLSRGLQQRLGLARCLLHDPSVLLLDEPASGMDWQARRELRDVLRELTRLGKTTLLASHVLPEISELCTEMGVMLGGRLVAEGTPSEIAALGGQAAVLRIAFVDASDREAAARLIEERQGVESLRPDGASGLLVGFDGGPREQAELLESVVRSGLQVARFGAERPSLEDAYLTLTAPEEDPA